LASFLGHVFLATPIGGGGAGKEKGESLSKGAWRRLPGEQGAAAALCFSGGGGKRGKQVCSRGEKGKDVLSLPWDDGKKGRAGDNRSEGGKKKHNLVLCQRGRGKRAPSDTE